MSFHRALSVPRLSTATKRVNTLTRFKANHFVRWQQTGATGGGGSTGTSAAKLLFYGATGAGIVAAGSIAYASYDSAFKSKVNEYIPGFSKVTDSVAGQWQRVSGSTKPSDNNKSSSDVEIRITPGVKDKESADKPVTSQADSNIKPVKKSSTKTDMEPEKPSPEVPPIEKDKTKPSPPQSESETKPEVSTTPEPIPAVDPEPASDWVKVEVPPESDTPAVKQEPEASTTGAQPSGTVSPTDPNLEQQTPKQTPFPVDSAVASVREETDKVAEKIMHEQVKDHQSSQTLGEQWLKDTAEVDTKLHEVFEEFKVLTSKVLEAQKAVIEAAKHHQQRISEAIHNNGEESKSMETIADDIASSEEMMEDKKKELMEANLEHQDKATILQSILDAAEKVGLKSKAEEIFGEISSLMADLQESEASIKEAESSSEVLKDYQEEAKRSREQLQRDLGTVPPKADLKQEAIVIMQNKKIEVLKQKLDNMEQEKAKYLAAALDKQKQKLEQLAEERLRLSLQKQKLQMEQQYNRKESEIARQFDSELREKIRLQSEAHTTHLAEALRAQADELGTKWSVELEMKLMEQEGQYQAELTKAMSRLRGIESMVNTVANAGEITRHQQSIRNACDTLSGALDLANMNPYDRYTFSKELSSLRETAHGDKFVLSVINSIPEQASSDSSVGIQSEAGLQERFQKVYRICKRVALVPENGGGLGTYALSYLQSLLVFNWRVKDTQDLGSLDTFDLLDLANDSMKRGDLEKAMWYVSHLQSESRRVAQDWLEDARLYLETRQAIRLIQTYTAATNIAFI